MTNERIDFDLRHLEVKPLLIGVDEAGRGPLAGPVVACAVLICRKILDNCSDYPWLCEINDSKKLSPIKRENLFTELCNLQRKNLIRFTTFATSHEVIDRTNILQATTLAMNNTIQRLWSESATIIIDGKPVKQLLFPHVAVIKGDQKSCCIGMASIIAKVIRDRIMNYFHKKYPLYGFAQHKGYGTQNHIATIRKYGLSPIHRVTFCKNFN